MADKAEKIISVKNVSKDVQTFTDLPPFEPGESRQVADVPSDDPKKKTVTPEQAEILERSPFMEVTKKNESVKGTEAPNSPKTIKAIE